MSFMYPPPEGDRMPMRPYRDRPFLNASMKRVTSHSKTIRTAKFWEELLVSSNKLEEGSKDQRTDRLANKWTIANMLTKRRLGYLRRHRQSSPSLKTLQSNDQDQMISSLPNSVVLPCFHSPTQTTQCTGYSSKQRMLKPKCYL